MHLGDFVDEDIFQSTPREGGDDYTALLFVVPMDFNPRPREGGDCRGVPADKTAILYFNPRPPRGGRPHGDRRKVVLSGISIHAPREGGDAETMEY